jgi:N-acetylmuramic acid 6-phosphate (MurNAc-6-P) etherase
VKVFVSYTTRDSFISKGYLESVDKVVSEYANTFIDLLHNTADKKQEFVEQELLSSDIILLISSKSTSLSPWVIWELKQARNVGIPIVDIPVIEDELLNSLLEINRVLSSKLISYPK